MAYKKWYNGISSNCYYQDGKLSKWGISFRCRFFTYLFLDLWNSMETFVSTIPLVTWVGWCDRRESKRIWQIYKFIDANFFLRMSDSCNRFHFGIIINSTIMELHRRLLALKVNVSTHWRNRNCSIFQNYITCYLNIFSYNFSQIENILNHKKFVGNS